MNIRDDFVLKEINEGYLVGGSIRDLFTKNCAFCDRDISIKGAENFARKIANKWDGTFIELDNENKIYRVVLPDKINFLDISELQGNTIEEDLKRRIYGKLDEIEEMLPSNFVRCHQSYIVNLEHARELNTHEFVLHTRRNSTG